MKYSIKEFAEIAHVSIRTIRYYIEKDLLPKKINQQNKQYLEDNDFFQLHMVLFLKSAQFSLSSIKYILETNSINEQLKLQKDLLEKQVNENLSMIELINRLSTQDILDNSTIFSLYKHLVNKNRYQKQFETTNGLQVRINFHKRYNREPIDWFDYLFNSYHLKEKDTILEIGAGTGQIWKHNSERIPSNINITLLDNSKAMISQAKEKVKHITQIKEFVCADALHLPFDNHTFSHVIANHVFMFFDDLDTILKEIKRVLKPDGILYCSCIGENNLLEFDQLLKKYSSTFQIPNTTLATNFSLQNGKEKLSPYFKHIKKDVRASYYLIDDYKLLADYLLSIDWGQQITTVSNKNKFIEFCKRKIETENYQFRVQTEAGYFIACND